MDTYSILKSIDSDNDMVNKFVDEAIAAIDCGDSDEAEFCIKRAIGYATTEKDALTNALEVF